MEQKNLAAIIFELENDRHLLDFKTYDNIPVWMIGRWYLLHDIIGGILLNYKSPRHFRTINFKMIGFLINVLAYNLTHKSNLKKKSIVLYSTNRKTIINDKFYNRYVDLLFEQFSSKSVVIEQALIDWEWPFPRKNEMIYFDTLGRITGELKGRLQYKKDYNTVRELLDYLKKRMNLLTNISLSDNEWTIIAIYLSKLIVAMRFQAEWLGRRIDKETKMVIAVGAGFPYYYFTNKLLKSRGIVSVELQHGYITKNNIMYNYAEKIVNDSRVVDGLPDYILTYGDWWNRQMNCPIKKISIGNPYHELCVKNIEKIKKNNQDIVIIGVGENTREYIKLSEYLSGNLKNYHIKFRPHPGEKNMALKLMQEEQININLDKNIELYQTLQATSIIIGEVSTVLFEAVGIVDRVLVWNTKYSQAYLPEHPFETFSSYEELVEKINSKNTLIYNRGDEFWCDNWEEKYIHFIKSSISI